MPTPVTIHVNTDNAGPTYDGLTEATGYLQLNDVNAEARDLQVSDEDVEVRVVGSATMVLTGQVMFDAWNPDPTRRLRIVVPPEHRHNGVWGAGVHVAAPIDGWMIRVNQEYTHIEGLSVQNTFAGLRGGVELIVVNCSIADCLIDVGVAGARGWIALRMHGVGQNVKVRGAGVGLETYDWLSITMDHVAATDCTTGLLRAGQYNTHIVKNSYCFDCDTDFSGPWDVGSSHNAATDGTAPGTDVVTQALTSAAFADAANGDYALTSGSVLRDAGTGTSDPDVLPNDIAGIARTSGSSSVGPYEFVPAADATAPTVPTGLTETSKTDTTAALSWSASTDAVGVTGYRVFRDAVEIDTTASTSYSDSGLTAETAYDYTVTAYDAAGNESAQSAALTITTDAPPDTTAPTVPAGLTETSKTDTTAALSWSASTDAVGVTGYRVFRDAVEIDTTASTSYSDSGLTAETAYDYTVTAYDAAGNESAQSAALTITTDAPPDTTAPTVPTGLAEIIHGATTASLAWTASTDAVGVTGYRVFRDAVEIGTTTQTQYSDTGLTAETAYNYTVSAYDAEANESAQSSALTITTRAVYSFTDNTAQPAQTYDYTVSAVDAAGNEGAQSTVVQVTTPSDTTAPSVPTGLTQTAVADTTASLSWSAATDDVAVTGYRVFRDGVSQGTTAGLTFDDTGLTAETAYDYTVAAFDAAGNESAQSAALTITTTAAPDTTAPSVPAGLGIDTVGVTTAAFSWVASTDAVGVTGYRVFRDGVEIDTTASTVYSDSGLTAETAYDYTVTAYDAAGNESAQSSALTITTDAAPDTTAPSVPTGLTETGKTDTTALLSWSASTDAVGVTGYRVFRDGVEIDTTASTSYSDSGLTASTAYDYTVTAYDAAGNESAQSTQLTITTNAAPDVTAPTVPTGLTQTAVDVTTASLSWSASTDAGGVTGYRVFRDGVSQGTTAGLTFDDTGLTAETAYDYTVAAFDAAGNESAQSAALTITTTAVPDVTAPTVPTGLTEVNVGVTAASLSWTASTDAVGVTGYRIFRDGVSQGTTAGTSFSDSGLAAETAYDYTVAAFDAAGNESSQSSALTMTTLSELDAAERYVRDVGPTEYGDIQLYRRNDVVLVFTVPDSTGTLLDLTGFSGRLYMANSRTATPFLDVAASVNGTELRVALTDEQTDRTGSDWYEFKITDPDGMQTTLAFGQVTFVDTLA